MRLPRLVTGGAVVAVLAGTAACGLQTLEPKLELRDAASAFTSARSTSLRLSLPSSLADARAFGDRADAESAPDAATSDGSDTGITASTESADPSAAVGGIIGGDASDSATMTASSEPMSDADLKQLLASRLDVTYDKGADAAKTSDDSVRALLHLGGSDIAEVRSVSKVLYARVDLGAVEQEFPDSKQDIESARSELTAAGQGSDSVPEALRAPAQAVFAGKWISVDDRDGSWLNQQLTTAGGSAGGGLAADAPAKLQAIAGKAFGDGVVTVKRMDGDDTLGDHLVATANLRTVYRNIRGDLPGLVAGDAATQLAEDLPAVDKAPDRDLSVSFWVKDGTLTRVELDVAQFLDKPAGHLVLRADTLPAQPIATPSGAVALDLQTIADANGGSLSGLFSGGTGETVDAQTAATWVDEDIREMADRDGVAPSLTYLSQVRQDLTDAVPDVVLTKVGKRVQVTVDGTTVCLKLARTTATDGTVTDGRC